MAIAYTATVGTTDYGFDWIAKQIHVEALVTEVSAADLKDAIHDAQDDTQGMSYEPVADFFNPVGQYQLEFDVCRFFITKRKKVCRIANIPA